MINQERVREMIKLAVYEKQDGEKHKVAMHYYRGDFAARHIFKAFLCATVAYGLIFLLWCAYHMETLMRDIDKMNLIEFGTTVLVRYLLFTGAYLIIVEIYANVYYAGCKRSVKRYYRRLRRLERIYGEEGRTGRTLLFEDNESEDEEQIGQPDDGTME